MKKSLFILVILIGIIFGSFMPMSYAKAWHDRFDGYCYDEVETGGDGTYDLCAGDTLFHSPSKTNIKIESRINNDFVRLVIDNSADKKYDVKLSSYLVVELNNGTVLKITPKVINDAFGDSYYILRVETENYRVTGYRNSWYGVNFLYVGDSFDLNYSGLTVKLESYNAGSNSVQISYFGADTANTSKILLNHATVITANNGRSYRLYFVGRDNLGLVGIRIDDEKILCAANNYNDDVVSLNAGQTYTDVKSGLTIKITSVNRERVKIQTVDVNKKEVSILQGSSLRVKDDVGNEARITFLNNSNYPAESTVLLYIKPII